MGIDVVMLTGDNETTAKAVQKQLDIPKVIAHHIFSFQTFLFPP